MSWRVDVAVIGAGIAGASLAAGLADPRRGGGGRIALLEAEDAPGYHSTGRSAAFWTESYGGPLIQPLTTASGPFLQAGGFLGPRQGLTLARADERPALDRFAQTFAALGVRIEPLGRPAIAARVPGLKPAWVAGVLEPDCCDIDVAALHQHWLAAAKRGGVELLTRARVAAGERRGSEWHLSLADGRTVRAGLVVNAAGAWADPLAAALGARPLGIQPYRRTVAQLRMARAVPAELPLVMGIDESFYFKPEAGRLWLSPHDETPSPPCDAAPEELDVALAIDRLEGVADWPIAALERKWAGLRSFAPDRLPVYGFDPCAEGLFWFAGQGGFGIQTAPAAADLALGLLTGHGGGTVDPARYAPGRFG